MSRVPQFIAHVVYRRDDPGCPDNRRWPRCGNIMLAEDTNVCLVGLWGVPPSGGLFAYPDVEFPPMLHGNLLLEARSGDWRQYGYISTTEKSPPLYEVQYNITITLFPVLRESRGKMLWFQVEIDKFTPREEGMCGI